jgi:hypothetical protein
MASIKAIAKMEDVDYYCIVGYFCDNVTGELEKHDVFYDSSRDEYYFNCCPRWKAGTHKKFIIPEEKVCRYKDSPYVQYEELSEYRVVQVGTFKLMESTIVYEYSPVEYDDDEKKQPREFLYDFERPKDFKYYFLNDVEERIFIWFDEDENSAEDLIDFGAKPRDLDDESEDEDEDDEMHQILELPKKRKRQIKEPKPKTVCNACNNTFWWSRGSGLSAKEEALKSKGIFPEDIIKKILTVQLGNDRMPLVPCYICNFEGHKPCVDLASSYDSEFWSTHYQDVKFYF